MEENILVKVGADISDLSSGMAKAGKEVQTFSSRMEGFGKNMRDIGGGIALSFGAIATGITVPLKQAVQTSVDFDSAMRRAATIAGATEKEFDALKKTALDLGAKTTKSAQEVAVAMSEMAAKGYDVNQIIAAMPGVIAAAEASGEDLALTADTVSSALNAFGLKASEASRVADILAQTANDSAAGIVDMSYAFKYAAPVVSSLGVSIEELAAATGIMADVGIRGEQAGTTLRGGLVQLLKPAEKTAKMMKSMGIEVTDANGKFLGLAGIIRELQTAMEGQTETQKLQTLASIVGTEAASGFLALMKAGPDKIDAMTKSLENSAGASAKAAKKMMGGLGGAIEQMSGSFETMKIIVGDHLTPTIQRSVEWVTKLIEAFNNAPPKLQKFISVAALVLATLTGFIAVVATAAAGVGLFMMSIAPIVGLFTKTNATGKKTSGVLRVLGGIFRWLVSPIGLVIGAIVGLSAAFVTLYKKSETFRNTIDKIVSKLEGAFSAGVIKAGQALTKLKSVFVKLVNTKINPFFENLADVFRGAWIVSVEKASAVFSKFKNVLLDIAETKVFSFFERLAGAVSSAFHGDFSGMAQIFGQLVPTIISVMVGGIPALILTAARYLPAIAEGLESSMPAVLSGITKVIDRIFDSMTIYLPMFIQSGVDILTKIIEGLAKAIPLVLIIILNIVTTIITAIAKYLPEFVSVGVDILTSLIEGISNTIPLILPIILTVVTTLITAIADFLPDFIQSGTEILISLINGLVSSLPKIVGIALMVVTTLLRVITDALPVIINTGITILNALIEGIIILLPALIDAALSIVLTIAQAITDNLPKLIEAGIQILDTLIDGIMSILPNLLEMGVLIILALFVTIIDNLPKIIVAGIKIIDALINGIMKILPQLLETGIMLIFTLFGSLIDNLPKILDAGVKILVALIDGIMKILPQLLLAGLTLIIKLAGALIQNLPKILAAGGKILLALLDGIAELIPKLLSLGWDLVKKLAGAIDDKVGDMFDVGANLIKGLWNGINSVKDWIIGKIGGFASGVVKAVKGFFGVHSPSKVFRDEIGKMLGLGLADGMLAMKSDVIGAAERLSEWATPEPPDVSLAYATPSRARAALSTTIGTVERGSFANSPSGRSPSVLEVHVFANIDGKELSKEIAEPVRIELDKLDVRSQIIKTGRRKS